MKGTPIVALVADALKEAMAAQVPPMSANALGKKAGVSSRTVGNFLLPTTRLESKSGKQPSGKLTELEMICGALDLSVPELLLGKGKLVEDVAPARAIGQNVVPYNARAGEEVPFSPEVRKRLAKLEPDVIRRIENSIRAQLDMPTLPASPGKVRTR